MKKSCAATMIGVLLILTATAGYAGNVSTPKPEKITSGPYFNSSTTGNCVLYARWLLLKLTKGKGTLPSYLESYSSKRDIKNSSKARENNVAIIQIKTGEFAPNGHVAVVLSVDDSGSSKSLVLLEAHYPYTGIYKRTIKGTNAKMADLEKAAGIVGYWDYRK